jgi:hypothetical protein
MRFFGADIITKIKDIAVADYNNILTTIKSERSDSGLELIRKFNTGICERQYPECVINLKDSSMIIEELDLDIYNTPEEFPIEILVAIRDNTDNIALRQEYYIEGLQRTFHGYHDTDISWITVESSIRAEAYTEQKETLRIIGVSINVRIL